MRRFLNAGSLRTWLGALHLVVVTLLTVLGCTEKPKGAGEGSQGVATFNVRSAVRTTQSKGEVDPVNQLPRTAVFDVEICFGDAALNSPLSFQRLSIFSGLDDRRLFSDSTNGAGCALFPMPVDFEFFAQPRYVEIPLVIRGEGVQRGEIVHKLAVYPWAVFGRESRLPGVVDISLSRLPRLKHAMIASNQARQALSTRSRGPDRPKLFFREVHTNITEHRYTAEGTHLRVIVTGVPIVRLEDPTGDFVDVPLSRGRLQVQPQLLHLAPEPSQSVQVDPRVPRVVALHDPVAPIPVTISPDRPMQIQYVVLVPNYNKLGELLLALDGMLLGGARQDWTQADVPMTARADAQCAAEQRTHRLTSSQFSGLYLLGPAQDPLRRMPGTVLLDTASRTATEQSLASELNPCFEELDFKHLMSRVTSSDSVRTMLDGNRETHPFNPSVAGWQPTTFYIPEIPRPFNEGIVQPSNHPQQARFRETVLERTVDLQLHVCLRNYFTDRGVQGRRVDVSINGERLEQIPQTFNDGCTWVRYRLTHDRYELQRFILKMMRVQVPELEVDLLVPVAINPWDATWQLGRDIRSVSTCLAGNRMAQAPGVDNSETILRCVRRDQFISRCAEGTRLTLSPDPVHGAVMSCEPERLAQGQGRSETFSLGHTPDIARQIRPHIEIETAEFSFRRIDYRIESANTMLDLKQLRSYMVRLQTKIVRHDNIIHGLEAEKNNTPDGFYLVRLVLQRNIQEDHDNTGRDGNNNTQDMLASGALTPSDCRTGSPAAAIRDARPDAGYITHVETIARMNGNTIDFPITLDFQQMYLLGSRNKVLIQVLPLDPEYERRLLARPPTFQNSRLSYQEVRVPPEDLRDLNRILPRRETLGAPTYAGSWTIFGTGSSEHDREAMNLTCVAAADVIRAGQERTREMEAENRSQFGSEAPSDQAMADRAFNQFVREYNLRPISMANTADQELLSHLARSMDQRPTRPRILDRSDPLMRLRSFARERCGQASRPGARDTHRDTAGGTRNPLLARDVCAPGSWLQRLADEPEIRLENFRFGEDPQGSRYPSQMLHTWSSVVEFHQWGQPNPGPVPLQEYLVRRHVLLRKLCMLWSSGEIYPLAFADKNLPLGTASPFLNFAAGQRVMPGLRGWSFDNPPTEAAALSGLRDLWSPPTPFHFDICKDPDTVLQIDKRIRILDLDRDQVLFRGGRNENYQVNMNVQFQRRVGADINQSQNDQNSLRYFTMSLSMPIVSTITDFVSAFIPLPLRILYSTMPDINRTHTWNSGRGFTIGLSRDASMTTSASTYLVVQKMDFELVTKRHDRCLVIRPGAEFFRYKNWDPRLTAAQRNEYTKLGFIICGGRHERGQRMEEYRVPETFYYVAQHFTPGPMIDPNQDGNRPWLFLIRGHRDFVEFRRQLESLSNRSHLLNDSAERSTQVPIGRALRNMFPANDGMVSVFEDPYYTEDEFALRHGPEWEFLRHNDPTSLRDGADCTQSLTRLFNPAYVVGGAQRLQSLPCVVRDADRASRR